MKTIKVGDIFGRLAVLSESGRNAQGNRMLRCSCICGNVTTVRENDLKNGHTKSCGCLIHDGHPTHKHYGTRQHRVWANMLQRVSNKKCPNYQMYGKRGISVCNKWLVFSGFWEDMESGYSDNLTIERSDVNGDYCKENCVWATYREQSRNTRRNVWLSANKEVKIQADWAKELKVKSAKIGNAIKKGMTMQEIYDLLIAGRSLSIPRKYNINGKLYTRKECVDIIGTSESTMHRRLRKGLSMQAIYNELNQFLI